MRYQNDVRRHDHSYDRTYAHKQNHTCEHGYEYPPPCLPRVSVWLQLSVFVSDHEVVKQVNEIHLFIGIGRNRKRPILLLVQARAPIL